MTTQPRGALFAYDEILGAVARGWTTPANESKTVDPVLAEAIAHEIQDLLSAGSEGDDNKLPEPFPRVHSYDPSGARRTVTVQWGGESFVSYVRYGDRSTWKEIPPINETPVERPAPSAGVVEFDPMLIADMLRQFADYLCQDTPGCYKLSCLREQADLIEASVGQAVTAVAPASAAGEGFVSVPKEEVLRIARMAEGLKRECGMDPESPQAIRNGQYMNISHALRTMLAAQGGSDG